MNCTKCGAQLEPGMEHCPLCGAPVEGEAAEALEHTAAETPAEETAAGTPAAEPTAEAVPQTAEEPAEETPAEPVEEAAEETTAQTAETADEAPAAQPVEGLAGASFEKTAEEAPAKKQTGRVALFAAVAVLAVAVLVFAVTSLGKKDNGAENPADAPGETTSENAALNTEALLSYGEDGRALLSLIREEERELGKG